MCLIGAFAIPFFRPSVISVGLSLVRCFVSGFFLYVVTLCLGLFRPAVRSFGISFVFRSFIISLFRYVFRLLSG